MLRQLHRAQIVWNFADYNISTVRLNKWVIQQCDAIGRLLHYTKNSLSSPCTSQHKHEQKDKTKTLVKFPDHVFIDFDFIFFIAQDVKLRFAVPKEPLNTSLETWNCVGFVVFAI